MVDNFQMLVIAEPIQNTLFNRHK